MKVHKITNQRVYLYLCNIKKYIISLIQNFRKIIRFFFFEFLSGHRLIAIFKIFIRFLINIFFIKSKKK